MSLTTELCSAPIETKDPQKASQTLSSNSILSNSAGTDGLNDIKSASSLRFDEIYFSSHLPPHTPKPTSFDRTITDEFPHSASTSPGVYHSISGIFTNNNIPYYQSSRNPNPQQHNGWMDIMSGGFTQSCSNWSMLKLMITDEFIQLMSTVYLPAVLLLHERAQVVISFSKDCQSIELDPKNEPGSRCVIYAGLDVNRLFYAAAWTIELLFHHHMHETDNVKHDISESRLPKQKFFNVKCVLPRSSISRFIGRGGDTIRRVQEESGLSMSVSTLDKDRSERILNMGFYVRDTEGARERSAHLDSLLNVFRVITNVLQTDRNYSINYVPIPENFGRPRLEFDGSGRNPRDQLVDLIRTHDAANQHAFLFDDIEYRKGALVEDAIECLAPIEVNGFTLLPAPTNIIDTETSFPPPENMQCDLDYTSSSFDPSHLRDFGSIRAFPQKMSSVNHFADWNGGSSFPPTGMSAASFPFIEALSHSHLGLNQSPSGYSIGSNPPLYPSSLSKLSTASLTEIGCPLSNSQPSRRASQPLPYQTIDNPFISMEIDLITGSFTGSISVPGLPADFTADNKKYIQCNLSDLSFEISSKLEQVLSSSNARARPTRLPGRPSNSCSSGLLHTNSIMGAGRPQSWKAWKEDDSY